jgi:ABC-type dipeptide/oligopeptide/nickel transport system permease component
MAGTRYRHERDVERKFVRQELISGWIGVLSQCLAVVLATILGVIAITHASHASEWGITAGTGGASIVFAGVAAALGKAGR